MWNRPTLSLIAAAFLCAASHAPSCAAEKPGVPFHFPKTIGDLPLAEIRQPTETNRATRVFYGVPGITLTLYIFGSAPEAPDGIESPQLNKEFEEAKQSVQDPRAWVEAKLVHEGTVDLGVAPHRIPARESAEGRRTAATAYLSSRRRADRECQRAKGRPRLKARRTEEPGDCDA